MDNDPFMVKAELYKAHGEWHIRFSPPRWIQDEMENACYAGGALTVVASHITCGTTQGNSVTLGMLPLEVLQKRCKAVKKMRRDRAKQKAG